MKFTFLAGTYLPSLQLLYRFFSVWLMVKCVSVVSFLCKFAFPLGSIASYSGPPTKTACSASASSERLNAQLLNLVNEIRALPLFFN